MCRAKVEILNGIPKRYAEAFLEDAGCKYNGTVRFNSTKGLITDRRYAKREGDEVHEVYYSSLDSRDGKESGEWVDAWNGYSPLYHTDVYSLV